MTPTWSAVYRESDGKLFSITTVVPQLRAGLASKPITGPPARETWNSATLIFDPQPEPPPDVDRVDEFIAALPNGFSPKNKTVIRTELAKLLGPFRFRDITDQQDLVE